ncbi:maturation protein [ssRNA phage Esthiorhiza.2_9]|uniref:Maturation protein n=2 Tax=Leviviricetes TaxID=2842243 RepID=A0A8S5KZQ0_9VIRU|nr:maturation protein [ssRNA phage Esthiorhiza.2_9]QDH90413.1 MAG: hypothetical protein H2RhizoLitter491202_000001 [Leviviridae sp.]DAD50330.1 TPA_asm: maturation protein [ssRNA phage Esthiorhiza.2_9]
MPSDILGEWKERDQPFVNGLVGSYHEPTKDSRPVVSITGRQRTYSQKNLWRQRNHLLNSPRTDPDLKRRIRRQDYGSTFQTTSNEYWGSHPQVITPRIPWFNGTYYQYSGPICSVANIVGPTSSYWPAIPGDISSDMITMGSTAIARTIPTNPASGVGQFLGELREGLPGVPGKAAFEALRSGSKGLERFREIGTAVGQENLNWQFGVKPILSDVQNFAKATIDSDKIIRQLARDSGRLIRRRYEFPVERSRVLVETRKPAGAAPALFTGLWNNPGNGYLEVEKEVISRTWFSGAYTYHYAQGQTLWDRMRRAEQNANRLYGLRLNPALVWELAPWSWLVDWISNLGDIMTNISAFSRDGLVLVYGYVMREMRISYTYTLMGTTLKGSETSGPVQQRFTTVVKKRLRASPYGFGLDPDWTGFSDRQLSILGSLGITRAPR